MSTEPASLTRLDITKIAFQTASMVVDLNSTTTKHEAPIFIDEACEITGYAKATLYVLIHKKQIPFHKAAGRRRLFFYKSELLSWMNASEKKEVVNG